MNDIISDRVSLCGEELRSPRRWILGPVVLSLVLWGAWDEILCRLSLFGEHAPPGLLLPVSLGWNEISYCRFWIVASEAKRWYSEDIIDNISNR